MPVTAVTLSRIVGINPSYRNLESMTKCVHKPLISRKEHLIMLLIAIIGVVGGH